MQGQDLQRAGNTNATGTMCGIKRLVGLKTLSPGSESRLKFVEVFNAMEAGAFEGGLCHDGGGSSEGRDPRGHRSHPSTLVQRLR